MTRIRTIQARLTRDEYDKIWQLAKAKGFQFISDYIRFTALDQDLRRDQRIREMHEALCGIEKPKRLRKNEVRLPFV